MDATTVMSRANWDFCIASPREVKLTFLTLPFSTLTKQDAQDHALFVEGYPVNHGHGLHVKSQVNELGSKLYI